MTGQRFNDHAVKLPTCTGHVSVHLYLSYALVWETQSCQPHSKGGNLALAAPQIGWYCTSPAHQCVPCVGIAESYQGSWCESPSLWVSLEVPQRAFPLGRTLGFYTAKSVCFF